MSTLRIAGGRVIDPANGVNDVVGDLWIEDGRVTAPPADPGFRADRTIDARGYVVMPGGVDVHSHIAGSKVNAARIMRPEERRGEDRVMRRWRSFRSGTIGSVPSSFTTGYLYAGLGYTTAVDAAIPPMGARHAHAEFGDVPLVDKAMLVLMGNNHLVLDAVREGDPARVERTVAWLLDSAKGYGVKAVNPGGVEQWKLGGDRIASWDDRVDQFDVSPREIVVALARAVDSLGLPHPLHFHGLNLGLPGNWAQTLEGMRALDGHRIHMAHIQFHSYGGTPDAPADFDSQVGPLADYVNAHAGITVDVGQVMFGETTSMTADGPTGHYLANLLRRKWYNHDVEQEDGCGVSPIVYQDRNFVHALQWAIGLEWFLRVEDPWRVAMSTDHPNGASFRSYPEVVALLMDKNLRDETLARLPERVRTRSGLGDLSREYSLTEVAIVTRAGPARILGLAHKGHLGPGADADVTIYAPDVDRRRMFALPRWVVKGGEVVVDDGELRSAPGGRTLYTSLDVDAATRGELSRKLAEGASFHPANFGLGLDDLAGPFAVGRRRPG
ncbi:formylmethanofuran dehydrogenase subunit A [Paludisphaera mucosa]|uniref:Formylmethanofuran dehydrogenase subunit A n=1 Tax=Paludisphaera mucosa TaxID=3030827 RepID=A0ABT6FFY7_9BACT|nr:formylmethanofuran dehydrogenase subunit A [Paludisphaera mucosa]MDG3006401.1 formylmethanofuran dehydrogenase subunit A [Paludisphaera mucosa]